MKVNSELLEQLKSFVSETCLLIDEEDRYVYSFEKIFRHQAYPLPEMIIKASSSQKASQILTWAKERDIQIILRGKSQLVSHINDSKPYLLLDTIKQPEIIEILSKKEKNLDVSDKLNLIPKNMNSALFNIFTAIKVSNLKHEFSRCQNNDICYGYCTVSPSFNDIETWTSKGRMLLIKGVLKGDLPVSDKFIDILYTCTTCGHCFAECFKDLELRNIIITMRNWIALKNQVPEAFLQTSRNIIEFGDPGGTPTDKRIAWSSDNKFQKQADNLLWIGCIVATRTPNTAKALFNVIKYTDSKFTYLGADEGCCGYILLTSGLWDEANKVANKLLKKIMKTKAQTLITPCAGCYYTFTKLYPEILDINFPIEVKHSSQFIENISKELNFKPIDSLVTYHDPCSLGRHCKVFDAPRNVLKKIPSLKFIEMSLNKEHSRCCGGGGGLWTYNHRVSMETAVTRLEKDLTSNGIDYLTTTCPQCQMNFRITSLRKKLPIKIVDMTELVMNSLL